MLSLQTQKSAMPARKRNAAAVTTTQFTTAVIERSDMIAKTTDPDVAALMVTEGSEEALVADANATTTVKRRKTRKTTVTQVTEVLERPQSRWPIEAPMPLAQPGPMLVDLGELVPGKLIKRPSEHIKTPYVADIELLSSGEMILGHSPSLDCAGLIRPGKQVLMTPSPPGSKAATSHAIKLVAETARANCEPALVGAHPKLAEQLAQAALSAQLIPELPSGYELTKEKTYGHSRVDFVLTYPDGSTTLVEVKNVTGADYSSEEAAAAGKTFAKRAAQGVYEVSLTSTA